MPIVADLQGYCMAESPADHALLIRMGLTRRVTAARQCQDNGGYALAVGDRRPQRITMANTNIAVTQMS